MERDLDDLELKLPANYLDYLAGTTQPQSQVVSSPSGEYFVFDDINWCDKTNKKRLKSIRKLEKAIGLKGFPATKVSNLYGANIFIHFGHNNDYYLSIIRAIRSRCPIITVDQTVAKVFENLEIIIYGTKDADIIQHIRKILGNSAYRKYIVDNNIRVLDKIIADPGTIGEFLERIKHCVYRRNPCFKIKLKRVEPDSGSQDRHRIVNIMTQYHNHIPRRSRDKYDYCIMRNLNNRYVKHLYLFVHAKSQTKHKISKNIAEHERTTIVVLPTDTWATFQDYLEYAAKNLEGEVVCISNLDIILDPEDGEWDELYFNLQTAKIAYCLTRYEIDRKGNIWRDKKVDKLYGGYSHDAWIFRAPLAGPDSGTGSAKHARFPVGQKHSNLAFAEYLTQLGYIAVNDSHNYRIYRLNIDNDDYIRSQEMRPKSYHLVPELSQIHGTNIDKLVRRLKLSDLDKYHIKCMILSRYLELEKNEH